MCEICIGFYGISMFSPKKLVEVMKVVSQILGIKIYLDNDYIAMIDYGDAGLHIIDLTSGEFRYGNDDDRKRISTLNPL